MRKGRFYLHMSMLQYAAGACQDIMSRVMTVDIKVDTERGVTQYTAMSDEFLIQDDPIFETPPLYMPDFVFDAASMEVRFDGFRPVASNQSDVIEGQVDIMREILKAHKPGGADDDD